jgi:nitrate reductase NapAB chaperone NapD
MYYDEYRYGRIHPIVGSTDSHGSTPKNRNWDICSTIVFAKENTREEILQSVRDRYTVAVDTISKEYRLVGEYRYQKYGAFLIEHYFPIHDKQAAMDGEMMYQYANGNAEKTEVEILSARAEKLLKRYIRLV